jgi:hypothetical protein
MIRVAFFIAFICSWSFFSLGLIGAIPWSVIETIRDTVFFSSNELMGLALMGMSFLSAAVIMAPEEK